MGCGASDLNPSKGTAKPDRRRKQAVKGVATVNRNQSLSAADRQQQRGGGREAANPLAGAAQNPAAADNQHEDGEPVALLGKQRYIADYGAVVMSDTVVSAISGGNRDLTRGHLIVFTNQERSNLVFVYAEVGGSGSINLANPNAISHHNRGISSNANGATSPFPFVPSGPLYVKEYHTDDDLIEAKADARITLPWASFFKSVASDIIKSKAQISSVAPQTNNNKNNTTHTNARYATFAIVSSKVTNIHETFTVKMDLVSRNPTPREMAVYVLRPLTQMAQASALKDGEKELRVAKANVARTLHDSLIARHREAIARVNQQIEPLRRAAGLKANESRQIAQQLSVLEYKIHNLGLGGKVISNQRKLDTMYTVGGPQFFAHASYAQPHVPTMPTVNEPLATFLAKSLSSNGNLSGNYLGDNKNNSNKGPSDFYEGLQPLNTLLVAPSDPYLSKIYQLAGPNLANPVMSTLRKLEDWDYSVFDLEQQTQGNALFYTCYSILHRLDLVSHFNIDDKVLQTFLRGVQAGYHPNPYHNKTHAADVCQVNYYIMNKGGLIDKLKLTKEDLLAGVLAGAIHDYDHPGFNNNFHTRTNAYLSTLYNDRSILENHHLACVFEMMRLPQFDIFKNLTDEQRRTVRETMIEMVLATDMGNHAAIFSSFRRRTAEGQDWHERREDIHLALSMSIKMADVSNCGRPNFLYIEWAKNISAEFYMQGDAEERRGLSISPFMDRKKDKTDFPKGQISFMNYVVVPMFEAIAEFLPPVECALQCCTENKEYWQHME